MPIMRSGLVLIDWQKGFRHCAYWGRRNNPMAEKNASALLRHWRNEARPVFHVRHDSSEERSPLRPDGPGNEIEDFAKPVAGERVYAKCVNSAFIGTALESDLRAAGIEQIVVSGLTTDHCVSTSVRMAANLGFAVSLVGDACYTFERNTPGGRRLSADLVHDAHLASLDGEFAQVVGTDWLLAGD